MTMHTPGPWFVSGSLIYSASGDIVAERHSRGTWDSIPGAECRIEPITADANAKLIAAAPALKGCILTSIAVFTKLGIQPSLVRLFNEILDEATL